MQYTESLPLSIICLLSPKICDLKEDEREEGQGKGEGEKEGEGKDE